MPRLIIAFVALLAAFLSLVVNSALIATASDGNLFTVLISLMRDFPSLLHAQLLALIAIAVLGVVARERIFYEKWSTYLVIIGHVILFADLTMIIATSNDANVSLGDMEVMPYPWAILYFHFLILGMSLIVKFETGRQKFSV